MRIAMYMYACVYSDKQTGGQKRFKELYEYLSERFDVTLYSLDSIDKEELKGKKHVCIDKVIVKQLSILPADFKVYFKNRSLFKRIKKENYDKVLVFDITNGWPLFMAGIRNIQLLIRQDLISYKTISLQNANKNSFYRHFYLEMMRLAETAGIKKSARIIVQCKYDLNCLISRHPLLSNEITKKSVVQINNVNPSWTIERNGEDNLPDENEFIGLDHEFVIGFVGNIDDTRKGFLIFEEALNILMNKGYHVGAYIIGASKKIETYRNTYRRYQNIHFIGWTDNPVAYLKKCNLVTVPSLADSCPNTVIEPMNAGIPVIGCNAGGIPELIHDPTAIFEPSGKELSELIIRAIEDPALLETIKKNQAVRRHELEFDWAYKISEIIGITQ